MTDTQNKISLKISQDIYNSVVSAKNFNNDINVGNIGEILATQYLEQLGLKFIRKSEESADLKKWDLEFAQNDKLYRYEIKNDVYILPPKIFVSDKLTSPIKLNGRDTGNIFIEFYCRNKPSGITTTTADVWMNFFFHLKELWMIPVSKLRQLISNNEFRISEESGDINSHTKGYLIPRNNFRNHFKVINYDIDFN